MEGVLKFKHHIEQSDIERKATALASDVLQYTNPLEIKFIDGVNDLRQTATGLSRMLGQRVAYYKIHQIYYDLKNKFEKFKINLEKKQLHFPKTFLFRDELDIDQFVSVVIQERGRLDDKRVNVRINNSVPDQYNDMLECQIPDPTDGSDPHARELFYSELFEKTVFQEPYVFAVLKQLAALDGISIPDPSDRLHDYGGHQFLMHIKLDEVDDGHIATALKAILTGVRSCPRQRLASTRSTSDYLKSLPPDYQAFKYIQY